MQMFGLSGGGDMCAKWLMLHAPGTLPVSWHALQHMQDLALDSNRFTGSSPFTMPSPL